ncbi:GYF domain-containing protein [Rubripirellula sp.]|nr:GYF domain-containing protein [Rubripirellula sp.]
MSDMKYHVRFKGRVLGPFDEQKIKGLIKRGQVTRTHEISPDGISWQPAAEYQDLFPASNSGFGANAAATSAEPFQSLDLGASSAETSEWYAHMNDEQKGPVAKSQLTQWVGSGAMTADTLVWKEGLENWEPAKILLPDLFQGAGGGNAGGIFGGTASSATADPLASDRSCPFCAQSISSSAIKCPHCQSMLNSFCNNCGAQCTSNQAICLKCGSAISGSGQSEAVVVYSDDSEVIYSGAYSKQTAGILALCLGGLGAHKFYHGSFGFGILYIVFVWSFIPAILAFIEGIMYLTMAQDEYDRRYNMTPPNPFKW